MGQGKLKPHSIPKNTLVYTVTLYVGFCCHSNWLWTWFNCKFHILRYHWFIVSFFIIDKTSNKLLQWIPPKNVIWGSFFFSYHIIIVDSNNNSASTFIIIISQIANLQHNCLDAWKSNALTTKILQLYFCRGIC